MDEDDIPPPVDTLCEKAETLRGIAVDLDERKSPEARRILRKAAEAILSTMQPRRAVVVALVPKPESEKEPKERPL